MRKISDEMNASCRHRVPSCIDSLVGSDDIICRLVIADKNNLILQSMSRHDIYGVQGLLLCSARLMHFDLYKVGAKSSLRLIQHLF